MAPRKFNPTFGFYPRQVVRYTTTFLKNTGQYASNRMNGLVIALNPGKGFGAGWPFVYWNDQYGKSGEAGRPTMVNPANLESAKVEDVPVPKHATDAVNAYLRWVEEEEARMRVAVAARRAGGAAKGSRAVKPRPVGHGRRAAGSFNVGDRVSFGRPNGEKRPLLALIESATTMKKVCKSKTTGKRVDCAKQRAGRKGAKSRAQGRRAAAHAQLDFTKTAGRVYRRPPAPSFDYKYIAGPISEQAATALLPKGHKLAHSNVGGDAWPTASGAWIIPNAGPGYFVVAQNLGDVQRIGGTFGGTSDYSRWGGRAAKPAGRRAGPRPTTRRFDFPITWQEGDLDANRRFVAYEKPHRTTLGEYVHVNSYAEGSTGVEAADYKRVRALKPGESVVLYGNVGSAFRVRRPKK